MFKKTNNSKVASLIAGVVLSFASTAIYSQTYTPKSYYTFENTSNPFLDSTGFFNLDATYFQGGYSIQNNTVRGVDKFLKLDSAGHYIRAGLVQPDTALTIEFLFKPGFNVNVATQIISRFDGAFFVEFGFPYILFNTKVKSGGNAIWDSFRVDFDGIGRKSYGHYIDGEWHHIVLRYSATTGVKQIWIDGECPAGFSKTIAAGTFDNAASNNRETVINSGNMPNKIIGQLDELAIYHYGLPNNMIYKHYLDFKNNNKHYQYANAAITVPAPAPVTAGIDISEYAPGHPSPTVSVMDQLKNFPTARYKTGHTLHPNIPLFSTTYLFGNNTYAPNLAAAVANSKIMFPDYIKNFNYSLLVSSNTGEYGTFNDTNTFAGAWIKMANQNPSWHTSAFSFWAQLTPKNAGYAANSQYVNCNCLPANSYLRNSSGQFLDKSGYVTTTNKALSPVAPLDSLRLDGLTQRYYLNALVNKLTRPLNTLFENGEMLPHFWNGAVLGQDPAVLADKNASGLDWYSYESKKHSEKIKAYRDQFMSIGALANTKFVYYYLDGHPSLNLKWDQVRDVNTATNGMRYASGDIYTNWPNNWRYWMGSWKGWQWVVDTRHEQLASGDKLFSPAVSPGWDNNEENNVRPAQWLGLMKAYSMLGAEFFYTGYFTVSTPFQNPKNWVWQTVIPSYAQGITSRYEDLIRNGNVMEGDVPNNPSTPQWNAYSFNSGDPRKLVVARKHNTLAKYAVTGTIQPSSNMTGATELEGVAQIKLDGQNIKFKIRRQGSTYFYDKTDAANPVFYQLDEWHETKYPYYWSKDFTFEAELFDNANTNIYTRTKRATGTVAGDFVGATSYIGFNSVSDIIYNFQPRAGANANYYVWVLARSKNAQNVALNITLDNGTAKQIGCIADTNWVWYRYNLADQTAISYQNLATNVDHQLKLTPTNTNLEIDRIFLTTNSSAVYTSPAPCSATAVPTITPNGPTALCQGNSVTLTASSGTSYAWSTGATTQAITVSTAGTYSVTVTTAQGTGTSSPVSVTVNALPTSTVTPSGSTTFCTGGSVILTASSGSSYLWNPGGQSTQSITAYSSGNYSVNVYSANGCSKMSSTVPVVVNTNPTATITASGPTTFNQGGSVTLTASAGTAYLWSPGGQTTQAITVNAAGNYTVRVSNASGCSTTSGITTVVVNNVTVPTITAGGPTTFCTGASVTLTATLGTSYLWSTGATTRAITVSSAGSYVVTVTSASGTGSSLPTVVVVNSLPTVTATASGATTFCQGGSVTLTSSSNSSYAWTPGGQTTQAIIVTASGTYRVTGTNSNNCANVSQQITVTVNALPTASITASGPTTFNQGGSVTLTASSGSSYLWSPGGQTTQSKTVTAGGSYTVRVTNASGCSATSAATVVTVNNTPVVPTITAGGSTTICSGASVVLTASAGTSYLWSNGATTQSINASVAGSYTVTVNTAAGSGTSAATIVTVIQLPLVSVTAGGATTFCQGGNVVLTSTAGTSYLWSPGGQTTRTLTATASGNYTVRMTNQYGCSGTSAPMAVTVNAIPTSTITASGPTTFNQGGSVTLTAPTSTSYYWLPAGQTTKSIVVTQGGTYQVRVTNSSGCSATSSALTVTVIPPANTATISASGATTFCTGGTVTLTASQGTSYLWSTGATTRAINVTTSGSYVVTVTSAAGSAVSPATVVTVNAKPSATVTANGPLTFCSGLSVILSAPSGTGLTYKWLPGNQTSRTLTVTVSGTYYVIVTNASGCTTQSTNSIVSVTNCGTCLPPSVLTTTNINSGSAKLNWNVVPADSFFVKLKKLSNGYQYFSGALTNNTSSITVGVTSSTSYNWWVRSKCAAVKSAWSVLSTFTTPALRTTDSTSFTVTEILEQMFLGDDEFEELNSLYNNTAKEDFKLMPNPAATNTQLVYKTENKGQLKIVVMDVAGRMVKQINEGFDAGLNMYDLDVTQMPKGVYMVNVYSGNGLLKSMRLMVQ